ncbi:MAG: type II toxin-antitoxin system PemK/MazF family toxin [Lachnospiraceae bacterium]|nr:type II toxin-antitoxin system PemK/MazF family toxin [Lachnospiraceae bacterium]
MIGKIYSTVFPYYDSKTQKNSFKKRPVLIIGGPRNNDYTVLPISTVTKKANLDAEYDLEINPANYPLLHLDKLSYVRVHKQTTVHKVSLTSLIGDMKTEYADLYLNVLEKLEEFNKITIDNAL